MSGNFWDQQQQNGKTSPEDNKTPRSGGLLSDFRQQQGVKQYSPALMPPPQTPPSHSPISPILPLPQQKLSSERQAWPSPQSWHSSSKQQGQGWVSNTMQMVRRWSAGHHAVPPIDQNPLVLYRPNSSAPTPKSKPWKRSRTVRITMQMKHRRERWKQARPKVQVIVSGIVISLLLLLVITTSSATAYAYQYYQDQLPRLQGLANQQIEQTTRIYDRNGNLLYEAYNQKQGGGRRTAISYEYLPQVLKDAQIAAEDKTFWTNSGVDPQAILRAGTQYLQAHAVQSGASTITQQLIKNLTGDTAQTLNRKIPEAALAIGLTEQYPKTKILEMYFNVSPYGAQNLGVEAAVEDYFHLAPQCDSNFKCIPAVYYLNCEAAHIKQCDPTHCDTSKYCDPILGLARASLLAGLPQSPSTYDPTFGVVDPTTGQKFYLGRQQYVLDQMVQQGMQVEGQPITPDMVAQAEALTVKMKFSPYNHAYYHGSQHFVQWVIQQLENQLGVQTFLTGGLNVRTTIDYKLEAYVEMAVHRHLDEPELQPFGGGNGPLNIVNNLNDSAAVVMNAKTGEVLAMDGSAGYNVNDPTVSGNINMAVNPRQPGSSFKPIVYATAFQQGLYPGIVLRDQKTYFPDGGGPIAKDNYVPQDYGPIGTYHNMDSSVHLAIANSFNIPAVKALELSGTTNVINMAQRLGITTLDPKAAGPSMALGTLAVPLIQMVGAYQVFANQGMRVPPRSILDIWDNYGHHLYHFDPSHPGGMQVLSPQIAYMMTSILSDEYARRLEFWPDHVLSFWSPSGTPDQFYPDVAAKTGTTDSFKDNWTLGYTQDVVVGVWSGNANDTKMYNVLGITGAAPIWHSIMAHVNNICNSDQDQLPCSNVNFGFKLQSFTPPAGLIKQCVSTTTGLEGTGNCDYMLVDEKPQQSGVMSISNNPTPTPTPGPKP